MHGTQATSRLTDETIESELARGAVRRTVGARLRKNAPVQPKRSFLHHHHQERLLSRNPCLVPRMLRTEGRVEREGRKETHLKA